MTFTYICCIIELILKFNLNRRKKLNNEEKVLMKDFAESIVGQVIDNDGFSECLVCDSIGAYKDSVDHTGSCIFHKATSYLKSLKEP